MMNNNETVELFQVIAELLQDISQLHRELGEKYEQLSSYFYTEDEDISEGDNDED